MLSVTNVTPSGSSHGLPLISCPLSIPNNSPFMPAIVFLVFSQGKSLIPEGNGGVTGTPF